MANAILEMSAISKSFPGVQALQDVSLTLERGETLALVGENGAGKSTLMKILGGVYGADSGEITVDGKAAAIHSPSDADKLGISLIHQEVNLVPTLTVTENIFLGKEMTRGAFAARRMDREKMRAQAEETLGRMGSSGINANALVSSLSAAKQQLVEIAKALRNQSRILIMDEPTSALTEQDAASLFKIIASLKKDGISIIYISHRLEEIEEIADRIIVLRDGKKITELDNSEHAVRKEEIVRYMVGRELTDFYPSGKECVTNQEALKVQNLSVNGLFENVSFTLHKGEILGFSGLIGAGRTEVAKTLIGEYKKSGGARHRAPPPHLI
jgi:ribose transport system ATP-binding protein